MGIPRGPNWTDREGLKEGSQGLGRLERFGGLSAFMVWSGHFGTRGFVDRLRLLVLELFS